MILQSIRWYLAYALSYRNIEALMEERGFSVDHSTINRWVVHYSQKKGHMLKHAGDELFSAELFYSLAA